MGSGSSRTTQTNRQIQVSSPLELRTRTPSPPQIVRPSSYIRRPHSSQPSPWLKKTHTQQQLSNSSLAHYASIWEQNGKLSSKFQELIRSDSIEIEHDQKETTSNQLVTTHSSSYELAHVESTLTSEVETIHNLSTSEKMNSLINNLKQTHLDFDELLKTRIGQITNETESILAQIVEETQQNQQDLLIQAKEQQTIEDEQYRTLLENFISQLDQKRAKQLSFIQEQLQQQRLQIFNESQLKIRAVSEQANSIKNRIMLEEENKISEKIDLIVTEINSISTESAFQQIGAEIKTNFNLTIHQTVGSNKSKQQLQFDNDHQHSNKHQIIKRTTFIPNEKTITRPTSSHLSEHQTKNINQLVKHNLANPKIKSQQPQ